MAKEKAKEKANQAKGAEGAQAQHQQSKKTAGVQNKIEQLKKAAVAALHEHRGNVSATCASIGIGRTQFYNWKKEDPEFAEAVDSVADFCIDIVEQALMKNIEAGDTTAIIFYLKTIGKRRGYVERSELDVKGAVRVNTEPCIIDWSKSAEDTPKTDADLSTNP